METASGATKHLVIILSILSMDKIKQLKTLLATKDARQLRKDGTVNSQLKDGKGTDRVIERKEYGRRTNIWQINQQQNSDHPASFPIELAHDHIVSWTNEGDVVLDPFMGSGTTAIVARALGRKYIGFEISQEYVDLANKRLQETKTLFD